MNNDLIDKVVEQIDIVEVISESVDLVSKGKNYVGLCPFHQDNNPSFTVSPEKKIYKCFVCENGGNVITFTQRFEKITFVQALEKLATRANITFKKKKVVEKTPAQDILGVTSTFYNTYLNTMDESKECRDYLEKREIDDELIDRFMLGFAPNKNTASFLYVSEYFKDRYSSYDYELTGNFANEADFFKSRLMIPIKNELGYVVGFSGRVLKDQSPKYLNSRDSETFNKSKILYNMDIAKNFISDDNSIILVEGFFDVIALAKYQINNVVATMGTSFTSSHLDLLKRYRVKKIILGFDQDNAGKKAAYKIGSLLLKNNITDIRIFSFDSHKDIDEFLIDNSPEILTEKQIDFFSFKLEFLKSFYDLNDITQQSSYVSNVLKYCNTQDEMKINLIQNSLKKIVPNFTPTQIMPDPVAQYEEPPIYYPPENNDIDMQGYSNAYDAYVPNQPVHQPIVTEKKRTASLNNDLLIIKLCMNNSTDYLIIKEKITYNKYSFNEEKFLFDNFEAYYQKNEKFELYQFSDFCLLDAAMLNKYEKIYTTVFADIEKIDDIFIKDRQLPAGASIFNKRRH